jgi:hypothetical protein
MQFAIENDEVRLAHLNVRMERHGEEEVTAIDLKLQWQTGTDALLLFHPDLRRSLYFAPDTKQRAVEGVDPVMSRLFPNLAALKWKDEAAPMKLTIHHGLGGKSDLVLNDCSVDKFSIEALEGGTVDITLRVQAVCEDEKILGKLALLLHRDMPVTLTPSSSVAPGDEVKRQRPLKEVAAAS